MRILAKPLLFILALLLAQAPAYAGPYKMQVNGTFNIVPDMPGTNQLAGLLGTDFAMKVTASDNPADASYTEAVGPDARGWCFCGPAFSASIITDKFSFFNRHPVVLVAADDYVHDGDSMLAAGTYDIIEWGGWKFDGGGGSLGSDDFYPGINYNFHMVLIGDAGLIANSTDLPSSNLDLSHVVYGKADVMMYDHGVLVGHIVLDPPLRLVDGVLVGDGMQASITAVPEPGSLALLLGGLGVLVARRRRCNT